MYFKAGAKMAAAEKQKALEAAEQEVQSIAREYSRATALREASSPEPPHIVRSCLGGMNNNKTSFSQTGGMPFRPWGSSPHVKMHIAPTIAEPTNMWAICRLSSGGMRASPSRAPTGRNVFPGWLRLCTGRA